MTSRRLKMTGIAPLVGLMLLSGCVAEVAQDADGGDQGAVCSAASAHLSECAGQSMTLGASCDVQVAEQVLSQSCASLRDPGKADFIGDWLCRLGFVYQCAAPACALDAEVAQAVSGAERCSDIIGLGGCAECEYYACREAQRPEPCGGDGYMVGFGRRYCTLFTVETLPRVSSQGQRWIADVRACLLQATEGIDDGQSCAVIRQQAYDSHPACYIGAGFCELPVTDMLAVLNTVRPQDLGTQPFTTAIDCLRRWFDPVTQEPTEEGWEQLMAEGDP